MASYNQQKRRLIGELHGRVLEIGAGTGANFGMLGRGVDWLGLEPSARFRRRLTASLRDAGRSGRVLGGVAERIPLADASVDAVLGTVVLCSVGDQDRALAEVVRVLRPGGRFVFFEHVAAPAGTWSRRLQAASAPLSRLLDHGCDPARETWRGLQRARFTELRMEWFSARQAWRYVGGFAVA